MPPPTYSKRSWRDQQDGRPSSLVLLADCLLSWERIFKISLSDSRNMFFFEAKKTFWTKGDNSNPAISVRSLWTCSPASCPNSSRSARPFWTDVYDGRTDTPSPWAMCQQFLIQPNKHDKSICHSNGRNPEGRRCHNQLWKNRGRPSVTVGKIMFSIPTWHLNPPSVSIDQIRSSFAWFSSQAPWHVIWLSLPSEPMDWLPICSAICKAFLARSWHALSICKWKN